MNRSRTGVRVLLVGAAVLATASAARAQNPYRETVVVTASALPVSFGEATRTINVLTRDQLAALPVHTVADALRLMASVDVRARGVHGAQSDFSVRGAGFGQMLVL